MKPSDREIATREASLHCDCVVLVYGGDGWSDAHKRQREEQNGLLMSWTMVSSLMDKNEALQYRDCVLYMWTSYDR